MQVFVKGSNNRINLTKNSFISSGGEGDIYAQKGTVFKIYQNPKVVIPYSKIKELSVIKNPNVIKPEKLVLNTKNSPIGYTMKQVPNAYSLCQIFPRAFRDRTGMNIKNVLDLVKPNENDRILDFGCETGHFLCIFSKKGSTVIGVDINETALKFGEEYCKGR